MKIEDISSPKTIKELILQFSKAGGFSAKDLATGAEIWKEMQSQKKCKKILSTTGNLIAVGTRGIIKNLAKEKKIDVIISTPAIIAHDLIRLFEEYIPGYWNADDKKLHQKHLFRLGNIFLKDTSYGPILENKLQPMLNNFYKEKKEWSVHELVWAIGEQISKLKNKEESILYWCWKNQIPVFIPGPLDGAFGAQLWTFWNKHQDFKLNLFEDEQALYFFVMDAKKLGALMIGGGISKHHTIWWSQFRKGLDYAIYITSAPEWDGSLSGARMKEAVSWGKVKESAKFITIPGDATIILPLVIYS